MKQYEIEYIAYQIATGGCAVRKEKVGNAEIRKIRQRAEQFMAGFGIKLSRLTKKTMRIGDAEYLYFTAIPKTG